MRINTPDATVTIPGSVADWLIHPDGDDLAVRVIERTDELADLGIPFDLLLWPTWTEWEPERHKLFGPGTEVFFVGRFLHHQGRERNHPTVRFGNIAQMPWEPVRTGRGIRQEAFLVEARSESGYSGSPVFVTPQYFIDDTGAVDFYLFTKTYLLGVDCGHFAASATEVDPAPEPVLNTGFMVVVPSWKLVELLNEESLQEARSKLALEP